MYNWPQDVDPSSRSTSSPRDDELLHVAYKAALALQAEPFPDGRRLEEDNDIEPDAYRVRFVYNSWVKAKKPSTSQIRKGKHILPHSSTPKPPKARAPITPHRLTTERSPTPAAFTPLGPLSPQGTV